MGRRGKGDEIQGGIMRRHETGKAAEAEGGDGFLAAIVGDGVLLLLATAASWYLPAVPRCSWPQAVKVMPSTPTGDRDLAGQGRLGTA
jgi:hypothetical protein